MRDIDIVPVSVAVGAAGLLPSGRGGEPIGASRPKVNIALTTLEGQGPDRTGRRKAAVQYRGSREHRRHEKGRMLK